MKTTERETEEKRLESIKFYFGQKRSTEGLTTDSSSNIFLVMLRKRRF